RMGTLRRQAQKAERYRKYKSEMKDIELWKASHRWLELAGESSLVNGRLGEVRTELDTVRTDWAIKDATVVTERAELVVEERRLVGVQEKVYELDNKIRLGDSKIGFELREADDLDVRVAGARTEIDEVIGQRERGAIELATRRTELEALEADVERETGEVRAREAAAGEARQMLANGEGRLEETRSGLADRKTQIATAQAQLEALAHRRGETSGRLDRVTSETELHAKGTKELEREMRRVDGALAELRQTRLDLGTQGEGFATRRENLAVEVARGEAEVETLRTELHRRRSRLVSLEEIQERYEGFARGTRAVMQGAEAFTDRVAARGEPIQGVVADVVRAPELFEVAVEAALGDRLGGVLVADASVGVAAIGYLKQQNGGRSAFVPMTTRDVLDVFADDSGVPEPVGDDKLGEARFQSAAMRSLGVAHSSPTFEGEGNPGRGDLSEPHVSPYGETIAVRGTHTDVAGPDMGLVVAAAELRARALVAAMQADAELARSGAALRARSLFTDAAFASGDAQVWPLSAEALTALSSEALSSDASTETLEIDALWTSSFDQLHGDQPDPAFAIEADATTRDARVVLWHAEARGTSALLAAMLADGQLASIGAALRARSLAAEVLLADPWFAGLEADGELQFSGAALRARSLLADAVSADPLLAGLLADAELQARGASLRA
ncbi:MAG: hypothetical protein H0V17_15875, partial [Deltaproteobacteria bacterium]|nr:hypothetical protein [Deltaproteobacteria bacterium]